MRLSTEKNKQDGNVPSRRHILGSKILKEQLLKIFEKSRIVPKKNQRGDPLVSPVLLEALKLNPRSPAWSKMEDEQIVRKVDHSE